MEYSFCAKTDRSDHRFIAQLLFVPPDPRPGSSERGGAIVGGAISFARIRRLYYGAADEKGGSVDHGPQFFRQPTCHHAPDVYAGIGELRAAKLLKDFFASRR